MVRLLRQQSGTENYRGVIAPSDARAMLQAGADLIEG